MDFSKLVLKRQSDRKYTDQPVDRQLIEQCLEAARMSPSACNAQPWHFIVVNDKQTLSDLANATASMGMNGFTRSVPVIVAVVLERTNMAAIIGSVIKNKEFRLLDLGMAVEHFCLKATELGLGTCIMGWFDEKRVKKLLNVHRRRIPLLIALGYPASETRTKTRKDIKQISSWNRYNQQETD